MLKFLIDGIEYEFEEMSLTYENSKVLDKKIAKENLLIFKQILDENDTFFSLMFGTLLGAIRENDFISHDIDIDVVTFDEQKLVNCIPKLAEKGLRIVRFDPNSKTYSFMKNGVYIDVYVVCKISSIVGLHYYRVLCKLIPKRLLSKFEKITFLGVEFDAPKNPIAVLEFLYGKTWQTPIKDAPAELEPQYIRKIKTVLLKILPNEAISKLRKFIK